LIESYIEHPYDPIRILTEILTKIKFEGILNNWLYVESDD